MIGKLLGILVGDPNEKQLKLLQPIVDEINAHEDSMRVLTDDDLAALTYEFKSRLNGGESIDDILPEAFAAVREASARVLGMRHFDVQMIGGVVLHQGKIAEMRTGEGKTLVATLAAYLNAVNGDPVHVVTVNDYLAKRDAEWMGPVYKFMGLSVGCLQQNSQSFVFDENYQEGETAEREDASAKFATVVGTHLRPSSKVDAYNCDIVYATNNELGFDYLRDHMVSESTDRVQHGLAYAIVDEVDNILIDEARTPLLISGLSIDRHEGMDPSNTVGVEYIYRWYDLLRNLYYAKFASAVKVLKPDKDFEIDLKRKNASMTEDGSERIENRLDVSSLYGDVVEDQDSIQGQELSHLVENAIRAQHIFAENRDYVVRDLEIVLVDEFTGRLMEGRRFSDGMHQALEGKHLLGLLEMSKSGRILSTLNSPGFLKGYEEFSTALDEFSKNPSTFASFEQFFASHHLNTHESKVLFGAIREYDRHELRMKVQGVASTYATITLQNYFRMYTKLSGMTGTAATEAEEFSKIYGLDVLEIPTNQDDRRLDHQDFIFMTEEAKWRAAAAKIEALSKAGRPVLVGTTTIEKSQKIADLLKKSGIDHRVLNAKEHESESHVIAQAGFPGGITVATNMAGRGTDIILGGNPESVNANTSTQKNSKRNGQQSKNGHETADPVELWQQQHDGVVEKGGLFVLGTERHESRRIDNQLRGRCARQGDPGETQFFLSVEDDLVRRFGGDRIKGTLEMFNWEEDVPIENSVLVKSVENAQQKVEGINFEIRKQLVDYDDVANTQRDVIYKLRDRIVDGGDFRTEIGGYIKDALTRAVNFYLEGDATVWDTQGFQREIRRFFPILEVLSSEDDLIGITQPEIEKELHDYVDTVYAQRELLFGDEHLRDD